MLVRALRLTDKLTNALLRCLIWLADTLAREMYQVRVALFSFLSGAWFVLGQTLRSGRAAYETTAERRREGMARRAESRTAQVDQTIVREDPLRAQNRALSLFTVLLLAMLIGLVLWASSTAQANRAALPPSTVGAVLPLVPTQPTATPMPPTPSLTPTRTQVPDPLAVTGSLVYSVRQDGRENLWARDLGQSTEAIRLTNTEADNRDPVFSPDGGKVAFASCRDGNWDLYVLDMTTGNITRLTYSLDFEAAPTWSPDGQFLAYEAYVGNNLDIYVIRANGEGTPQRLTYNPAPEFAPAWTPGGVPVAGRQIAYISLRDGNAEIYIISLDSPYEDEAIRLTNTPDINEEHPAWNPAGTMIAYSARVEGNELIFTKPVAEPQAEPRIAGQGREPSWSPDGQSLIFALDIGANTTLVGALANGSGRTATAITVPGRAQHPHWIGKVLPPALLASGGVAAGDLPPIFTESVAGPNASPPLYQFRTLPGVSAPLPVLSDRVDDSFNALRQAVLRATGYDFLGRLQDASWSLDRLPEPGQPRQAWYYAGRAFAFDRNLVFNQPIAPIEIMREDIGARTFWRVYVRVDEAQQGGQLGEPLKALPWDFASRGIGDPQAFEQGGRIKPAVPSGYYVDLTRLAEDFGWERAAAGPDWRSNFPGIRYWEFYRQDGLQWNQAMLELYTQFQIDNFLFGPPPAATNTPIPTETEPAVRRTATPIPPDGGGN